MYVLKTYGFLLQNFDWFSFWLYLYQGENPARSSLGYVRTTRELLWAQSPRYSACHLCRVVVSKGTTGTNN